MHQGSYLLPGAQLTSSHDLKAESIVHAQALMKKKERGEELVLQIGVPKLIVQRQKATSLIFAMTYK